VNQHALEGTTDMLFLVRFTDHPNSSGLRKEKLKDHLGWLKEHREQIPCAGSLREEEDENPVGGCWVVEAESKGDVDTLIQTDPFTMAGLRSSIEILHWSLAFGNNTVPEMA